MKPGQIREYDMQLVPRLLAPGEIIDVNGVPVELKPVPDPVGPKKLDPRYFEFERGMFEKKLLGAKKDESLQELRDRMGEVTSSLTTGQMRTLYFELDTEWGKLPVWGYHPRYVQKDCPALIYIHGGGYFIGSSFDTENGCRLISEVAGGYVFNVDYPLSPEAAYPSQLNMIYETLKYVHDHADDYGIDPARIYVSGDSAGGNFAAALTLMDRDKGTNYIAGEFLIYPCVAFTHDGMEGYERKAELFDLAEDQMYLLQDLTSLGGDAANQMLSDFYVQGKADLKDPYISPVFADVKGLPPTFIALSEFDGLRLEGEYYAKMLMDAGVDVRVIRYCGMGHGFFDKLGRFAQAEALAHEIAGFMRRGTLAPAVNAAGKEAYDTEIAKMMGFWN